MKQAKKLILGDMSFADLRVISLIGFVGLGAMFGIVVLQAMIVQNRLQLDDVSDQLEEAQAENERLQFEVIELESPNRIQEVAIGHLGLERPERRSYLPGVDPIITTIAPPLDENPFAPAPLPEEFLEEHLILD